MLCRDVEKRATCNDLQVARFRNDQCPVSGAWPNPSSEEKKRAGCPALRESAFEHDRLHADLFCDLGTCFHNPRELLIRFNLGRCTNKPTIVLPNCLISCFMALPFWTVISDEFVILTVDLDRRTAVVFLERKEVHRVIDHFIFLESENVSICLVVDITNYTSLGDLIGFLLTRSIHGEVFPLPDRAFHVLVIRVRFHNMFADFILLRRSSKLSETLRTAMQTQPIRATTSKARTRKEIFAVETSTGAADKYF